MSEHPHLSLETLLCDHPALLSCRPAIEAARDLLLDTYRAGGKLLLCGNGGSAADCDHISGELLKGFLSRRPLNDQEKAALASVFPHGEEDPDCALLSRCLQGGLPAIPLTALSAVLSAFANDVEPCAVFAQLVWGLGEGGDTLVCLSTSGNSRNVVLAAEAARAKGMAVLSLTGERESALSALSNVTIQVPATETYRVQEYHLPVYHYLCAAVEQDFWGE